MDEYTEAKFRIFANQGPGDTFVGNLDDPIVAAAPGEDGNRIRARALWFARDPHRATTLYIRNERTIVYAPPSGDPRPVEIMDVREIPLFGAHNVDNVMAAILVGLGAGLDRAAIVDAVRGFKPLHHRLETVAEHAGVTYVDDSKATNPGAVMAALRSFDRPIVLIAGGKSKGTEFSELGKVISSRTKAAILIGEAAPDIAKHVKRSSVVAAGSMDEAVARAAEIAEPGDVVLLSPGCASFDMFASAEARGEAFAAAVTGAQHVR
jgi:UDP-N-acetylmuramoylalanine--D-glutamate ligase